MNVESLYKDYVQKSRIFLYPLLGMQRGGSVTPIQTYVSWEGHYSKEDNKFVTLYHIRQDEEFRVFERNKLLGHPLFHNFKMVEEGKGVYVFDFSKFKADWDHFLEGRYSMLSTEARKKIQTFFGIENRGVIDSYLYPERYFKMFAGAFTVDKRDDDTICDILKEVGQLCSKPELDEENLTVSV